MYALVVSGVPNDVADPGGQDDRAEFPSTGQQVAIQAAPLHPLEIPGPAAPVHRRNPLFP